jgi:ribonuclease P protein component
MKASHKPKKLSNSRQYRKVYDQGQRFHTPFFSVFVLKNDSDEQRIGITVTRKIGDAVIRNRCKRRLREIVRKMQFDEFGPIGFDLIINVRSAMAEAKYGQLQDAFCRVVERIKASLGKQGD